LLELQKCQVVDRFRAHSLTSDAAAADLIIFVEFYGAGWYFQRVRQHPLVRRYREKCFLVSSNPLVIPFLPGVYSGVEKRWAGSRTRPGVNLGRTPNDFITYTTPSDDLPYLFSFMGSVRNAAVRAKLATLCHPRSFFQDTADDYQRILDEKMDSNERREFDRRYADLTKASKFVLCPRGISPSSVRLFETMRMGRVPVILSDDWVPPIGPRWDEFSLRIRERDFGLIPRLLEDREPDAVKMGQAARMEWERWFGDDVRFHHLVELCLDIRRNRKMPERWARWSAFLHYLQPFHLRRLIGTAFRVFRPVRKSASGERPTWAQQ
jgi:hypothetical protein